MCDHLVLCCDDLILLLLLSIEYLHLETYKMYFFKYKNTESVELLYCLLYIIVV